MTHGSFGITWRLLVCYNTGCGIFTGKASRALNLLREDHQMTRYE